MGKTITLGIEKNNNITLGLTRSSGTANYEALTNKPQINGVTLIGNKTSSEIKVQDPIGDITPQDIDNLIYG